MRRIFLPLLVILPGCSTVATIAGGSDPSKFQCDEKYTITRVYSGISNDIRYIRGDYSDKGIVIWDIPFSLVADTVALPYTIYTQSKHGNLCNKKESP